MRALGANRVGAMLALVVTAITNAYPVRPSTISAKPSRAARNIIDKPRALCARCNRPSPGQCLCPALPEAAIHTATRVLILQHPAESKKRIASVPLLKLCLAPVTIVKGQAFVTRAELQTKLLIRPRVATLRLTPRSASDPVLVG